MSDSSGNKKPVDPNEIQQALERVLQDAKFVNSPRLQELLSHLVTAKLDGKDDTLKGFNIAVDVFNRTADFDSDSDSLVRVQAGRLRNALPEYYHTSGADDPIRIVIPKGTYVPSFECHAVTPVVEIAKTGFQFTRPRFVACFVALHLAIPLALYANGLWPFERNASASVERGTPDINTLAVLPFHSDDSNARHKRIANSLTLDLMKALGKGNFLSVAKASPRSEKETGGMSELAEKHNVRFLLTGTFLDKSHPVDNEARLMLSLIDGKTGVIVWNESYDYSIQSNDIEYKAFLENVSYDLNPAYYAAAKRIVENEGIEQSSALELFLISNWVPGTAVSSLEWELERVALARKALEADPDYGPAHSVLADKLAFLATIDPPSDTEVLRSESALHATRALSSANQNADILFNMAIHKMHLGEIEEAAKYSTRTAELDPKNALASFFSKAMIYTCRPSSETVLIELVDFHNKLNPRSPVRWITAHIIGRVELNRKNYAEAVWWGRESEKIFQSPDTGYQLAAALVQTGEVDAAQQIFEKQRALWPNMDANHFAEIVIPRRCRLPHEDEVHLQRVYLEMAEALK